MKFLSSLLLQTSDQKLTKFNRLNTVKKQVQDLLVSSNTVSYNGFALLHFQKDHGL